jgi:hypothetical protein
MSNSAAQTKASTETSQQPTQQKQKPPVLEEDDEFEDFPVEGESHISGSVLLFLFPCHSPLFIAGRALSLLSPVKHELQRTGLATNADL